MNSLLIKFIKKYYKFKSRFNRWNINKKKFKPGNWVLMWCKTLIAFPNCWELTNSRKCKSKSFITLLSDDELTSGWGDEVVDCRSLSVSSTDFIKSLLTTVTSLEKFVTFNDWKFCEKWLKEREIWNIYYQRVICSRIENRN